MIGRQHGAVSALRSSVAKRRAPARVRACAADSRVRRCAPLYRQGSSVTCPIPV
ncbi:hypothetical protein BURMUCF1_A1283 [Burkholderia multivorans ATCC BAA-247]|uniref:Uncharacterized protein n=1 Tax=Burkholderia multivorans CGD2 TaxID=513052 RepID=B9BJQ8_9BURK|nr:hypothetical protein BURMUCGD2_5315 [Burkholderia multivorans CGD2]EEE15863.1 hypothetical protein BURMUCGD2M_5307 [Burkholderia multivorans CGD2M]EJO51635.1 hypothetical protein BURMUCF1_A1283 [Burkholderia multivorans ATCC BAA-247]